MSIADDLANRDTAYFVATTKIFTDILHILDGIVQYTELDEMRFDWKDIRVLGHVIVITVHIRERETEVALRKLDVGLPVEIVEHGDTQDVVDFLTRMSSENASATESASFDENDILTQIAAEQSRGKIH